MLVFNLTHRALLPRRFLRCSNPSILAALSHPLPPFHPAELLFPRDPDREGGWRCFASSASFPCASCCSCCPAVMDGYWFWLHPTQRSVTSCQGEVTANPSAWRQHSLADCFQGHWGLDSSLPPTPLVPLLPRFTQVLVNLHLNKPIWPLCTKWAAHPSCSSFELVCYCLA